MSAFDFTSARLNLGFSQRALAREAGVGLATVQRLEGGLTATPSNAKKVADVLGVRVTDLMSPVQKEAA